MADFASLRKAACHVIRVFRSLKVLLMAGVASCARQVVVVVDVAVGARARRDGMGTGQRKAGLRVIELAIGPLNGVMALFAGSREAGVRHRRRGFIEIVLVARNARGVRDVVVVVDVAIDARPRRDGMGTRQVKAGLRVIELAIAPLNGVMALLAGRRDSGVRHRRRGFVEFVLVARYASRIGDGVVVVDVAIDTRSWRHRVRSGE